MNFTNKPLEWSNPGQEPSEELVTKGFEGGYKPPASLFNNKWARDGAVQKELQEKLGSHVHDGTNGEKIDYNDLENAPITGESKSGTLTVASWTGSAAPYEQTVAYSGITTISGYELVPVIDFTNMETAEAQLSAWGKILGGETTNGGIKVYAKEIPEIDLAFNLVPCPALEV